MCCNILSNLQCAYAAVLECMDSVFEFNLKSLLMQLFVSVLDGVCCLFCSRQIWPSYAQLRGSAVFSRRNVIEAHGNRSSRPSLPLTPG